MSDAVEKTKTVTRNEVLKTNIPTLAGNIAATLSNPELACFSADDEQFLKFHGIYQQDDRDKRKIGKHYMFMIRGRIPGGVLSAAQYRVFDDLATTHGNQTLRITTRQSFQFHGVVKTGLGPLMKQINEALVDTLAACGDVNRNVMAPVVPATTLARQQVYEDARRVSEALLPITKAYHSIWVEGVQLNIEDPENSDFVDPLYGKQYLPRKFKTAFVIPPVNDMDVFTNCLGFIAIVEGDRLLGYNLTAGGGMGRSHGNEATYPRMADVIGFITPEQLIPASKAVLTVHRDFGDRTDRKHARLKYVLEEKGADWFRAEVEARAGFKFGPARAVTFTSQTDLIGWQKGLDGKWFLGLWVDMGRVKDAGTHQMKSGLRAVADQFPGVEFRLTANQNIVIANVDDATKEAITGVLTAHGVRVAQQASALHLGSMACPALPTCGLSLAESERYLPTLVDQIEGVLGEVGLGGEEIFIRMTGCPNGCARPYMAEIGFVGKGPGRYQLWLGGNATSTRVNRVYKEMVKEAEILPELKGLFTRFAAERQTGERFGDWVARTVWTETPAAAA
jgi:sulfite reductase (NADPH) hemoprotein beta-component